MNTLYVEIYPIFSKTMFVKYFGRFRFEFNTSRTTEFSDSDFKKNRHNRSEHWSKI